MQLDDGRAKKRGCKGSELADRPFPLDVSHRARMFGRLRHAEFKEGRVWLYQKKSQSRDTRAGLVQLVVPNDSCGD